jgi:hypothetical protein
MPDAGSPCPTVSVATYRDDPLHPRIARVVATTLEKGKVVASIDVLIGMRRTQSGPEVNNCCLSLIRFSGFFPPTSAFARSPHFRVGEFAATLAANSGDS